MQSPSSHNVSCRSTPRNFAPAGGPHYPPCLRTDNCAALVFGLFWFHVLQNFYLKKKSFFRNFFWRKKCVCSMWRKRMTRPKILPSPRSAANPNDGRASPSTTKSTSSRARSRASRARCWWHPSADTCWHRISPSATAAGSRASTWSCLTRPLWRAVRRLSTTFSARWSEKRGLVRSWSSGPIVIVRVNILALRWLKSVRAPTRIWTFGERVSRKSHRRLVEATDDWLIDWLIGELLLLGASVDWLIDWFMSCSHRVDRTDWLIDWLIFYCFL